MQSTAQPGPTSMSALDSNRLPERIIWPLPAPAARHARGLLAPGEHWRQESITGGVFTGWIERPLDGAVVPRIRGRAFVTGETVLRFERDDPFREGFGP